MKRWVILLATLLALIAVGSWAIVFLWGQSWAVAVLSALGGGLALTGLGWGVQALASEYRELAADLDELTAIVRRKDLTSKEQNALLEKVRRPSSTNLDVLYVKEWIRRLILEHAVQNLRYPALITVAGIVCATAASVWSVWV